MRLRTALNEYKRDRARQFPEESPTTTGAFSGHGDRLVHVGRDGAIRDYSAALSGLYGIDRSRFAIEADGDIRWFDDLELVRQHYYRETSLVETEFDAGGYTIHQFDLTIGRAHLTHVELQGAIPTDAHLTAFVTLAPEGRETRVGRLIHENGGPGNTHAVEVYHRNEHDYITASTGLSDVRGQIPERFDEILSSETFTFPREAVLEQYEDTHLSSDIVVSAPLERDGRAVQTTLVTQLSDHQEVSRDEALSDLRIVRSNIKVLMIFGQQRENAQKSPFQTTFHANRLFVLISEHYRYSKHLLGLTLLDLSLILSMHTPADMDIRGSVMKQRYRDIS
jgi:hypothetical protein